MISLEAIDQEIERAKQAQAEIASYIRANIQHAFANQIHAMMATYENVGKALEWLKMKRAKIVAMNGSRP